MNGFPDLNSPHFDPNMCYFSDLFIDHWVRMNGDVVYQDPNTSDSVVIPAEALEKIATGFSLI